MNTGKTIKWIPLDVDSLDDPKIMALNQALGLEGWGIYTMLILYLAKQESNYSMSFDSIKSLSYRNHVSEDKVKAVIQGFGLFEIEDGILYSASLKRRMESYEKNIEIKRDNAKRGWETRKNAGALPAHSGSNEDKIREDKRRIHKIRKDKNISLPFEFVQNQNELLVKKWYEWCEFRKLLKKPYKTTPGAAAAYNKLLRLADNVSEAAIAIINQSIENEWLGFFPLKNTAKTVQPGEDPIQKEIREVEAAREARLKREAIDKQKQKTEALLNGNHTQYLEKVNNGD